MSVGLLLITHGDIGACLLATAAHMMGPPPLRAASLAVREDADPEALRAEACRVVGELDEGDGVLVLTDIFGGTPSNVAHSVHDRRRVHTVSGVNLPMLVRVLNYPGLGLAEMAEKAVSGGRDGVLDGGEF